ncbi:MAG: Prefoldin subunit [Thermoplasmata archaeon]|nr:Prefoldin subunit [Thermoplasmata archaeon]
MAAQPQQPRGPSEQEIQQLLVRGDTLRQQLAALEAQREYVGEVLLETRRSQLTLENLEKARAGDEILVPLGAGAFAHATLRDPATSLASLGSGVHAELPTPEAAARLRARGEQLEKTADALAQDAARVGDELARINAVMEQVYGG